MLKKIAIISEKNNDFIKLLEMNGYLCDIMTPQETVKADLDRYDAFAVLGGGNDEPIILYPREREKLEAQLKKGKKFFIEFTTGISNIKMNGKNSTRFKRPVLINWTSKIMTGWMLSYAIKMLSLFYNILRIRKDSQIPRSMKMLNLI